MSDPTSCCPDGAQFCARCDLLVGLEGLHVIGVERHGNGGALTVTVQSETTAPVKFLRQFEVFFFYADTGWLRS
jgi:hypothetical protein